jgi:hypothetical protein
LATYVYNGEVEIVYPTLGLTLTPGDTFDSIEELDLPDVSLSTKKNKTTSVVEPETVSEPVVADSASTENLGA